MGNKTEIDWCDATCNFVIGCPRGCEYCYARIMNDTRFHWVENFSKPEFKPNAIKILKSKKPKAIFMNSLSDVAFWEDSWGNEVDLAMMSNPQHKYIFLTKDSIVNPISTNCFYGLTIPDQMATFSLNHTFDFLSIEPILEPIKINDFMNIKQVIIGAETGKRKDKVIPKKEWIDDIVKQCDEQGVRVFMKGGLRKIMGDDFRQDELIWKVAR